MPTKTTLYLNSESTFDWHAEQWAAPINFGLNQMVKIGDQPLQVAAGGRYWSDAPVAELVVFKVQLENAHHFVLSFAIVLGIVP